MHCRRLAWSEAVSESFGSSDSYSSNVTAQVYHLTELYQFSIYGYKVKVFLQILNKDYKFITEMSENKCG